MNELRHQARAALANESAQPQVFHEPCAFNVFSHDSAIDLWIVSDEAYEDVIYAPNVHHSIGALAQKDERRVVSVFSFSKSHAMSGLRTGYIVARDPILHDRIPKVLRCTINGVNSLAQSAALAAVTARAGRW